jgi:hypothetical protein
VSVRIGSAGDNGPVTQVNVAAASSGRRRRRTRRRRSRPPHHRRAAHALTRSIVRRDGIHDAVPGRSDLTCSGTAFRS